MEVRTQKRPFLLVFCDIFICWKLLPCFVVIGVDFHYRFINICYDYFPIPQMFFSLFLYGIIYLIFKNIPLKIVGGLKWYEYVRNGGARSMRTCAYDGGGGSNFCHFSEYVLIEW